MEIISMKGLVEKAHGKICQHDNNSVVYRAKDGKMFSQRRCNPRDLTEKPYSQSELTHQSSFGSKSKVASAWTAANRVLKADNHTVDVAASTEDYRKMRAAFDAQDEVPTFQAFVWKQIQDGVVVVPDVEATSTGGSSSSSTTTTKYTLTLVASPSAGGSVSGGGQFTAGTVVTVTATAKAGYSFSKWNDNVTTASRSVTVNSNQTLTATFVADGEAGGSPTDGDDDNAEA